VELNWLQDILQKVECVGPVDIRRLPEDETWVVIPFDKVFDFVKYIMEDDSTWHLSAITGQDTGSQIELLYHFWLGHGLTLCTRLAYENPQIKSITALIPGAAFYEREAAEMLGIGFTELKDKSFLLLPDAWGKGWPLRKEKKEKHDD